MFLSPFKCAQYEGSNSYATKEKKLSNLTKDSLQVRQPFRLTVS